MLRTLLLGVISPKNLLPELFISPRGLISILLFFSLPEELRIQNMESGLLFFIILSSGLMMTFGLIYYRKGNSEIEDLKQPLDSIFPPKGDIDRSV